MYGADDDLVRWVTVLIQRSHEAVSDRWVQTRRRLLYHTTTSSVSSSSLCLLNSTTVCTSTSVQLFRRAGQQNITLGLDSTTFSLPQRIARLLNVILLPGCYLMTFIDIMFFSLLFVVLWQILTDLQIFKTKIPSLICSKRVIKNPTAPCTCCHTTLWSINARKQAINDKLQGSAARSLRRGEGC